MSAAKDVAAAIAGLVEPKLKDAPSSVPDVLPDQGDPMAVLVQSVLMWNATTEKAATAYEKIRRSFLDWNDLRVSMAEEVAAVIGPRYPEVEERCRRLRAILRNLYLREHEMSFKSAEAAGKRSIRKYLESIQGMVPYVSERTLLVAFGGHAMPVDEPLRLRLVEAGIVEPDDDDAAASAVLQRHVKATDALRTHLALQAWIDEVGPPKDAAATRSGGTRSAGSTKKTTTRKTTRKTSKKTTAASSPGGGTSKTTSRKSAAKKTAKTTTKSTARKTTRKASDGSTTPRSRPTKSAGTAKKTGGRAKAGRSGG